jgi:hypothetical protein
VREAWVTLASADSASAAIPASCRAAVAQEICSRTELKSFLINFSSVMCNTAFRSVSGYIMTLTVELATANSLHTLRVKRLKQPITGTDKSQSDLDI